MFYFPSSIYGFSKKKGRREKRFFLRVKGTNLYIHKIFKTRFEIKEGAKKACIVYKEQANNILIHNQSIEKVNIESIPRIKR